MRRLLLGGLAALAIAGITSCALLPRYPSIAKRPSPRLEDDLIEAMNPWLLADGFAERVEVEVDWVEGCRPGPKTIEGLREILRKYGPAGRPIEISLDDEIPRAEWDEPVRPGPAVFGYHGVLPNDRVQRLVERHADLAWEPFDPDFRTERRYVLFAPEGGKYFGYSADWKVTRGSDRVAVSGVVVFRNAHRRYARLWLSLDKMERMTLIHEFGHQMGLVANPSHERRDPHKMHCTSLKCAMAHPTPRVIARNFFAGVFNVFFRDYCERCQEDIRRAQDGWRARLASDPSYRARLVADRQASRLATSLTLLAEQGKHEQFLAAVEQARQRYPNSPSLASMECSSLIELGRLEEARKRLEDAELASRPSVSPFFARQIESERWNLGRAFIASGRPEEAIALFPRERIRTAGDYEFEQSAFVLEEAYERAGRLEDAISLIDELLSCGHSKPFSPRSFF